MHIFSYLILCVFVMCTDNCCYCAPVIVGVVCTDYQLLLLFKNNGACCAPIIVIVCTQIYCYWLAVYAPNIVVIGSDVINCCCCCAPIGCGCVVCTDYQYYCCYSRIMVAVVHRLLLLYAHLFIVTGWLSMHQMLLCTDWVWLIMLQI